MMMSTIITPIGVPSREHYPFDAPINRIVKLIASRGWRIPTINIEFSNHRGLYVSRLTDYNDDFSATISYHYEIGLFVSGMVIPGKEFHIYPDGSGPSLWVYVGDNWDRDRWAFSHYLKCNAKLSGKPRTYLRYLGKHGPGPLAPCLVATNDLDRDYSPQGDEPTKYSTSEVMEEFATYFSDLYDRLQIAE